MPDPQQPQIRAASFGKKRRNPDTTEHASPSTNVTDARPTSGRVDDKGTTAGGGEAPNTPAAPKATTPPPTPAQAAPTTPRAGAARPTTTSSGKRDVGKREVCVYLSVEVAEKIRDLGHARRITNGDLVMNALESASFAALKAEQPMTGSLFTRPMVTTADHRGKVQFTFSWLPEHIDVLDGLVATHDAENRSRLVEAAFHEYLKQHSSAA